MSRRLTLQHSSQEWWEKSVVVHHRFTCHAHKFIVILIWVWCRLQAGSLGAIERKGRCSSLRATTGPRGCRWWTTKTSSRLLFRPGCSPKCQSPTRTSCPQPKAWVLTTTAGPYFNPTVTNVQRFETTDVTWWSESHRSSVQVICEMHKHLVVSRKLCSKNPTE